MHAGRVTHVTLQLPHSTSIGITGVYAPAGQSATDDSDRHALYKRIGTALEADE